MFQKVENFLIRLDEATGVNFDSCKGISPDDNLSRIRFRAQVWLLRQHEKRLLKFTQCLAHWWAKTFE